jgi:hypothetical protein
VLAERLGFAADARLLIVNCDDLGVNPEATAGCLEAMRDGVATDATLMVPCPDAANAASATQGFDVGVHLTLTCEWADVRWGPVTGARSLQREDGGMYRSVNGLLENATAEDVRDELLAQVERALAWGVDVTHLDSHMYALHDHEPFFEIDLEVAREFGLPVRLAGSEVRPSAFRRRAREAGVVAPDHLVPLAHMGSRADLCVALRGLPAGVTEFHAHPSLPCGLPDSAAREDDLALFSTPSSGPRSTRRGRC